MAQFWARQKRAKRWHSVQVRQGLEFGQGTFYEPLCNATWFKHGVDKVAQQEWAPGSMCPRCLGRLRARRKQEAASEKLLEAATDGK